MAETTLHTDVDKFEQFLILNDYLYYDDMHNHMYYIYLNDYIKKFMKLKECFCLAYSRASQKEKKNDES